MGYRVVVKVTVIARTAQKDASQQTFPEPQFQRPSTMCQLPAQHAFDRFFSLSSGDLIVELNV